MTSWLFKTRPPVSAFKGFQEAARWKYLRSTQALLQSLWSRGMKGQDALRWRLMFCVHATRKASEPGTISPVGLDDMSAGRGRTVWRDASWVFLLWGSLDKKVLGARPSWNHSFYPYSSHCSGQCLSPSEPRFPRLPKRKQHHRPGRLLWLVGAPYKTAPTNCLAGTKEKPLLNQLHHPQSP